MKRIDSKSAQSMITESGYKSEPIEVETPDGYIIRMDRIRRPESYEVTYF
jgi:hypothetical protein